MGDSSNLHLLPRFFFRQRNHRALGHPPMETTWSFSLNSQDAWDAMYEDCLRAVHSIDFEQYILDDDPCSQRFFDLFQEKARQGLRVRVLCDMVGSFSLYESSKARELTEAGVKVLFFNPISPLRVKNVTGWFFRDHRKLLVIDGAVGHAGGVGLSQVMERWRDTHMSIRGPVVEQMQVAFDKMWMIASENRFIKSSREQHFSDRFLLLTNAPYVHQRHLYHALLQAIRNSHDYLFLTTPYFVPSIRLFRALRRAARRGVDVRLLLPGASNHPVVDLASRSFWARALKAGIRVYRFRGAIMHTKTCTIDDAWSTVGSINMDSQSLVFNHEANLITTNLQCTAELKGHFLTDLAQSDEVLAPVWQKRSLIQKFLEPLTWPIRGVL